MEETKKGMQRIADLGGVGDNVRIRIAALREGQNLSYAALARLLEEAGRPLGTLALRRIEAGARRVDVDDLVAIALVLGATPNSLMVDPRVAEDTSRELDFDDEHNNLKVTATEVTSFGAFWDWLDGHRPLWKPTEVSAAAFAERNRANVGPYTSLSDVKNVWAGQAAEASHGDILRRLTVIEEKLGIDHGSD